MGFEIPSGIAWRTRSRRGRVTAACVFGLNKPNLLFTSSHSVSRSEMPVAAHYSDYKPDLYEKTKCTSCWYSCRGETQSPTNVKRAMEYMGIYI